MLAEFVVTCYGRVSQGDPIWRYMLSLAIADHTKSEWITAFSESGEVSIRVCVCVYCVCARALYSWVLMCSTFAPSASQSRRGHIKHGVCVRVCVCVCVCQQILFGGMTADEFRNREIMEPGFKERMQDVSTHFTHTHTHTHTFPISFSSVQPNTC